MLIYGESEISAYKKTIKQFLQPMIEQVCEGGGGDVPGGCAASFASVFQSYCIFVSFFFFHSTDAFLGRFYQYLHIFAVYYLYFIKKSNSVLGTKLSWCTIYP